MNDNYNESYYNFNKQNKDRIGNILYSNIIKKNFKFKNFLDYGCGVGFLLKKIEKIKGLEQTCGFEINDFAIQNSIKNTNKSKIYNNLNDIKMKFDLITMLHIVEHINDSELNNLISEIKKKLSKGGYLLISTPAKDGLAHKIKKEKWVGFKDITHVNLKSYDEWINFFQRQKLLVTSTFSDGLWDFPYRKSMFKLFFMKNIFFMTIQIFTGKLILKSQEGETFIFILKNNDKNNII